ERAAYAVIVNIERAFLCRSLFRGATGSFLGAFFAIQHIGASHIVFARAHQGELDLVLDVFYMKRTAAGPVAHQGSDNLRSKLLDEFTNTCGSRALPAVDRQKSLGHGDSDLAGLEAHYRAVAPDD